MRRSRILKALAVSLPTLALLAYLGNPQAHPTRSYESWAPFWLATDGLEATILLTNNLNEEVPFSVQLFDASGRSVGLVDLTAGPNGSLSLSLADLLEGEPVRSGSAVIRYDRDLAAELPAQMVVADPDGGLAANYLFSERRFHSVPEARAAFWLPTSHSELHGLLLNKSDAVIEVELEIRSGRRRPIRDSLSVRPGALATFGLRERYELRGGEVAGAVRVSHRGRPGDLVMQGFVLDSGRGFSTPLQWSDAGFASQSNTVLLKHVRYGRHEAGLFEPRLILSNQGASPLLVHPLLRLDGRQGLELPSQELRPGEVRLVRFDRELLRRLGPAPLDTALELTHDGPPGNLVAAGVSVDRTLGHAVTSKVEPETRLSEAYSYPFRIGDGWNTKVVLANRTSEAVEFCLFFYFDGRNYTYSGTKALQAYERRTVDLLELRERAVPDEFGRLIPPEVAGGQVKLVIHGEKRSVIAQAVVENAGLGISIPLSCSICPPQANNLFLLNHPNGPFGTQAQFFGVAGGPEQIIYPVISFSDGAPKLALGARYSSDDETVAKVDETGPDDVVRFLSAGQARIGARVKECFWRKDFANCEPEPGGFGNCDCECLYIELTVPPSTGFFASPRALVHVSAPILTIEDVKGVPKNGVRDIQVTIPQGPLNVDVTLKLSTTAGGGSAKFSASNSTTLKIKRSGPVRIKGIVQSSTADNIRLKATLGSSTLAIENFSVVWVTLAFRHGNGSQVSSDNAAKAAFASSVGTSELTLFHAGGLTGELADSWHTSVEIVGSVTPSNYAGKIILNRSKNEKRYGSNCQFLITLVGDDTSGDQLRDDNPQSGRSVGRVYDVDAPGIGFVRSANPAVGTVARVRLNLDQWATLDKRARDGGIRVSNFFAWYSRVSVVMTQNGTILMNDAILDNRAGIGDGSLNCQ